MTGQAPDPQPVATRAVHWLAVAGTVLTWPLLLVGGTVTVYRVGMAVPDWPTSFGVNMFLYDFLNSPWGVFIEHGHRLYGALVGVACLGLVAVSTWSEAKWRSWLLVPCALLVAAAVGLAPAAQRLLVGVSALGGLALLASAWFGLVEGRPRLALAWFSLAAVVGQGLLGGYRVRLNSPGLAFVHGCTAQAFFGTMVALWVVTGRSWTAPLETTPDVAHLRRRAAATLVLIFGQIVLGGWIRHGGDNVAVLIHAFFALAVYGHVIALMMRTIRVDEGLAVLRRLAFAMLWIASLQVVLGVISWFVLRPFDGIARTVWPAQAFIRIAHQGLGALLLGSAVAMTLQAFRRLRSPESELPTTADRALEAVG